MKVKSFFKETRYYEEISNVNKDDPLSSLEDDKLIQRIKQLGDAELSDLETTMSERSQTIISINLEDD